MTAYVKINFKCSEGFSRVTVRLTLEQITDCGYKFKGKSLPVIEYSELVMFEEPICYKPCIVSIFQEMQFYLASSMDPRAMIASIRSKYPNVSTTNISKYIGIALKYYSDLFDKSMLVRIDKETEMEESKEEIAKTGEPFNVELLDALVRELISRIEELEDLDKLNEEYSRRVQTMVYSHFEQSIINKVMNMIRGTGNEI